jgi:hypothetical protein
MKNPLLPVVLILIADGANADEETRQQALCNALLPH